MKKNFRKKEGQTLFRRRFLPMLLYLFLPVAILFLLLIHAMAQESIQYMKRNEKNQLRLLEQMLSAEFFNASEIVKTMELYQNVSPFYLQRTPSKASNLIHTLNAHFTNNNIVDEIFMHFFCDEYFYSTKTSYSVRSFMNLFGLPYGDGLRGNLFLEQMEQVESADEVFYLRDIEPRQSVSQTTRDHAILYVYPYEVDGVVVGSVIFQINEANLNSWIDNSAGRDTYIFNSSLSLLNASDFQPAIEESFSTDWIAYRMQRTVDGSYEDFSNRDYYVLSGAITDTGLYYIRFVENRTLLSTLQKIQNFYLLLLLLLLLFCWTGFSFLFEPLRRLKSAVPQEEKSSDNIVDAFLASYNTLRETNLQFQSEADANARKDFLLRLLNDKGQNESVLFTLGLEYGISLHARYHFAVIAQNGFRTEDAVRGVFSNEKQFVYLYSVDISSSQVAWVIGTDRYINRKFLQKACHSYELSVGKMYAGVSHIHDSYIDARSYWDISLSPQPYYWQLQESIESYYKEQIHTASNQLETGAIEEFCSSVEALHQKWSNQDVPRDIQCRIWIKLICLTDKILQPFRSENEFMPIELSDLIFIEQPEILFELLNQQIDVLLGQKKKQEQTAAPPLALDSVLQFIDNNCTDENFSLQLLADHFNVSLSYLSLFFKERYGENLLNYYTALRMEKARELLGANNLPLREIALAVGYTNVSSFIRRFKQLYGVTPGDYRLSLSKENFQHDEGE